MKQKLIEAIVEAMCADYTGFNLSVEYEYRHAAEKALPVIEEFVGRWLKEVEDDRGLVGHDGDHVYLAELWHEELE